MKNDLLNLARRIQSIAQAGITYSVNDYDLERYSELLTISFTIYEHLSNTPIQKIASFFSDEKGYLTPKVDVRGVIFNENKILLVKEKIDDRWSIPGGWADVGYTPSESVVKEVKEEAGIEVEPQKVLAVYNYASHPHPPHPFDIYKIFFLCKMKGGEICGGHETISADFFGLNELPPLSTGRNTFEQIDKMFYLKNNPSCNTLFD